jgi:hypothetical protein
MAIIIVFEVFLLAIILTKLTYDVFQYRRTGELPWLARHICLGYNYSNISKSSRHSQIGGSIGERKGGVGGATR